MIELYDEDPNIYLPHITISPTSNGLWIIERRGTPENHAYATVEAALWAAGKPGPFVASIAAKKNKTILTEEDLNVPAKPDSKEYKNSHEEQGDNDRESGF